jgi:hypothetical protein
MATPNVAVRVTHIPIRLTKRVSFPDEEGLSRVHYVEQQPKRTKDIWYQDHEIQRFVNDYQLSLYRKALQKECSKKISAFFSFCRSTA